MSNQTPLEAEVAKLIVDYLNLEDVTADDIKPEEALFNEGLGLDSIDALELSMAVSAKYGFQLKSDNPNNKAIFYSLRSLTQHIEQNK